MTFASTVTADATVSAFGLIEGVSTGSSVVSVALTSDADINTSIVVTLAT